LEVEMRVKTLGLAGLAAMVLAGTTGMARAQGPGAKGAWVHVRVEEANRQSKVSVNLPISVVNAALQVAPEEFMSNGHIHLGRMGNKDLSVSDLRKAWNEMKATGDAEFATVEDEGSDGPRGPRREPDAHPCGQAQRQGVRPGRGAHRGRGRALLRAG
jgi:hypothetical protein